MVLLPHRIFTRYKLRARTISVSRLPLAGRRRLQAKDSLVVHWDRPTTFAMARQHTLQLPLLLNMIHNQQHHMQIWTCATCCWAARGLVCRYPEIVE